MIYIKACPKCKGDVEYTVDSFGAKLECLQCSYTVDSKVSAKRAMDGTEGAESDSAEVKASV